MVNKAKLRRKRKKKAAARESNEDDREEEATVDTSQETLVNGIAEGDQEHREEGDGDGAEDAEIGYFQREDATRVRGCISFRVVDCEIVPGHDRDSWSLQIEGSLLSVDEEERLLEQERQKVLRRQGRAVMSGGLALGSGSTSSGGGGGGGSGRDRNSISDVLSED